MSLPRLQEWLGFIASLSLSVSSGAAAQTCPDTSRFEDARAIVADLGKIVTPAGLQETHGTQIGGIEQWINVRGQDRANPILLFVHGGPASPAMPTAWQFQRSLEEYFTVVHWDQRALGMTHAKTDPERIGNTIVIQRYVDDAIEVAEHLRRRYAKEKVILVGHSWGTIVATRAALARPDLFYAYVGIGQVVNVRENERISFEYGLEEAKRHGNTNAIEEMQTIAPYPGNEPITRERIVVARKWAQYYGGLSAYRETSTYFFRAPWLSPDYDDEDRCAIDQGKIFTLARILPEFLEVDFTSVRSFPIPIFMFIGRHDYTTPSAPTDVWLRQLDAPLKLGVWFEHSAHMIPWEEPGKFLLNLVEHVRPIATEEAATQRP
jgi:pimeloyl-ACP methyl ester carboxylesterase